MVQWRSVTAKPAEQGRDTTIKRVGEVLFHPSKSVSKYNVERRIQREERQGTGSKENSWKKRENMLSVQGELRRVSCRNQRQKRERVRMIGKQQHFCTRLSRVTKTETRMDIIKLLSAVRREINVEWKPWLKMPIWQESGDEDWAKSVKLTKWYRRDWTAMNKERLADFVRALDQEFKGPIVASLP